MISADYDKERLDVRDEQQEQRNIGLRLRAIARTVPFINERHCSNCEDYHICWVASGWLGNPELFAHREGWPQTRVEDHLKRTWGGICGNFVLDPHNVDLNKMDTDKQWDK